MFDGQAGGLLFLPLLFLPPTLYLGFGVGIGLRRRTWKTQCVLTWNVL